MTAASSLASTTSNRRIRILIADDHPSIRKAVRITLLENMQLRLVRL